jgi:VanZ family protein
VSSAPPSAASWRSPPAQRAWLVVLAWLAVILLFSSDAFSTSSTGSVLRPILRWLFPDWSSREIWRLHFAIRKLAHVAVYGVLALLALRALRLSLAASARRHAGLALALVLGAAVADEFRQSLTQARTGSAADIGYDLAGGATALGLAALARRTRAALRRRPPPVGPIG